jgi:hypothetical protein
MPTTMQDREQAFEALFAHDEEMRFRVAARRDKLFAKWAASRIGASEADLMEAVLGVANGPGHDQAVLDCVGGAFLACGMKPPDGEMAAALDVCGVRARRELMTGPG